MLHMMKKTNLTLSLVALLILLVAGAAYYWHRSSPALPAASTNTSTVVGKPTVLLGTIQAIQGDILTLALEANGGNAKITISSSTVITTNVPKDAKTLAAEFTEYQALKAKAGEKPFTPPSPSVTKTLSQSDLKVGLMILVTPQVYSTTEATAVSVVVVPSPASSTPAI